MDGAPIGSVATATTRSDPVLELAYDAAIKALEQQEQTLGALRNRSTGLLSAAAVATTFSAGLGLFSADDGEVLPEWAQWSLLVLLLTTAGCCIAVMWPTRMAFGPDPRLIMARRTDGVDVVRDYVIDEAIKGKERNHSALERKFLLYRLAVLSLTAETAVLVLALIVSQD